MNRQEILESQLKNLEVLKAKLLVELDQVKKADEKVNSIADKLDLPLILQEAEEVFKKLVCNNIYVNKTGDHRFYFYSFRISSYCLDEKNKAISFMGESITIENNLDPYNSLDQFRTDFTIRITDRDDEIYLSQIYTEALDFSKITIRDLLGLIDKQYSLIYSEGWKKFDIKHYLFDRIEQGITNFQD